MTSEKYTEDDVRKGCIDHKLIEKICGSYGDPDDKAKCVKKHNDYTQKAVEAGFKKCITDKMKQTSELIYDKDHRRINYKGTKYMPESECSGLKSDFGDTKSMQEMVADELKKAGVIKTPVTPIKVDI